MVTRSRRALAGIAACVAMTLACTERARELIEAAAERVETAQTAPEPAAGPVVLVSVAAPGYAPTDVENLLTRPLEEELASLPGLERLTSTSSEGEARLQLIMEVTRSPDRALLDARARVDEAAQRLPSDAEPPLIRLMDRGAAPDWTVTLTQDMELAALRRAGQELVDALNKLPGVARVELCGGAQELRIVLDPRRLPQFGMTLEAASDKIEAALRSRDLPAGRPMTIRARGSADSIEAIAGLVIEPRPDGAPLLLRDFATIELAPARLRCEQWTSKGPAVGVAIWRAHGAELETSARAVRGAIAEFTRDVPGTVTRFERESSHHLELRSAGGREQLEQLAARELPRILEGADWTLATPPAEVDGAWTLIITATPERDQTPAIEGIIDGLRQLPGLELRELLRAGVAPPRRVAILQGPEPAVLLELAGELSDMARQRPDLTVSVLGGVTRRDLQITLDRERLAALGVSRTAVTRTIALASGRRVDTLRRGRDVTPIILTLPPGADQPEALLDLTVQGGAADEAVPLRAVVELRQQLAPAGITREDQRRSVRVEFTGASLQRLTDARALEKSLSAKLELPPGYTLTWR